MCILYTQIRADVPFLVFKQKVVVYLFLPSTDCNSVFLTANLRLCSLHLLTYLPYQKRFNLFLLSLDQYNVFPKEL